MQTLSSLPHRINARVLVRVDYNVPCKGNKIIDTRRIDASFDTITTILKKKGTPVLIAHRANPEDSLRPIATYLSKTFNIVFVAHDIKEKDIEAILDQVPSGTVILLENIRRYEEEEKNTASFAKRLATLGSYYVNDAFSVSHRAHASIVGIPKYLPAFAGKQLLLEIKTLTPVVAKPSHPFLFLLGGSKFATKIPLISRFLTTADHIVITGALLTSFYKALGFEVGASVVEDGYETRIKALMKHPHVLLPVDVLVVRGTKKVVCSPTEIEKSDIIVDIGPQTVELIVTKAQKAKLVVWNGPTGWYEKGFIKATTTIASALVESRARSIIGGGDTGAVVEKVVGDTNKKVFISTGGGATIDFLASGTLPGITALG